MANSDELLIQLVEQSRNIYRLADAGEWEEAVKLEKDRSKLIEACFASTASFDDPKAAAEQLQEIMDIDAKVMGLGAKARGEASQALGDIQRGRQAVKAYSENKVVP